MLLQDKITFLALNYSIALAESSFFVLMLKFFITHSFKNEFTNPKLAKKLEVATFMNFALDIIILTASMTYLLLYYFSGQFVKYLKIIYTSSFIIGGGTITAVFFAQTYVTRILEQSVKNSPEYDLASWLKNAFFPGTIAPYLLCLNGSLMFLFHKDLKKNKKI